MKMYKHTKAVLCCALLAAALLVLSACGGGSNESSSAGMEQLSAPTNVAITLGADDSTSTDDTVTFDAVENASFYQVYVYQEGDDMAKVTESDTTTASLADPLDPGVYQVAVVAAGDGVSYSNSLGSEAVTYEITGTVLTPLGQVSDIAIDFSNVDEDNSVYPTISFTGVENASRYLVDIYRADENGEKVLTSLGYTTRLTVPADQTDGCMMSATNFQDLTPGYFIVSVTACGDDETYSDGEAYEQEVDWLGVEAVKPVITAEEASGGGISVALSNYEDYKAGTELTLSVYSDEACTQLVTESTLTYTTSESFGNTIHNNTAALEVTEADGDLVVGQTYYIVGGFDPVVYTGETASEPVAVTCATAGTGSASSASGEASGGASGEASGEAS